MNGQIGPTGRKLTREQWLARAPQLSAQETLAMRAWDFCEGWHPETIELAAAYLEVADLAALVDHMLILREAMAERRGAQNGGR